MNSTILQHKQTAWLLLLICSCSLQSCFVNRYRTVHTEWEKNESATPVYYSPDSMLKVSYSLWSEYGKMNCVIVNRTDSTLYIVPYYTIDILFNRDSLPMTQPEDCYVADSSNKKFIRNSDMYDLLNDGIDIPIPPKGYAKLSTIYVDAYLRWDERVGIPDEFESKHFLKENSPFVYTKQIAYTSLNDEEMHVMKHSCYVDDVQPFRFTWFKDQIPEKKKRADTYYLQSRNIGPLTFTGLLGLVVLGILADNSEEGE